MKACCTITTFTESILYCIKRDNLPEHLVDRINFSRSLRYWRQGLSGHEAYETIVRRLKRDIPRRNKRWAKRKVRKILTNTTRGET